MTIKRTRFEVGVEVTPTSVPLTREGEIRSNESSKELEVFLDEETRVVVTENQEQVLENKEIDADLNTISNLEVDNLKTNVLNTDPSLAGADDSQIPSAKAVLDFVNTTADGKVSGPITSRLNAIAVFSSTTGKSITGTDLLINNTNEIRSVNSKDLILTPDPNYSIVSNGNLKINGGIREVVTGIVSGVNGDIVVTNTSNVYINVALLNNTINSITYNNDSLAESNPFGRKLTIINGNASDLIIKSNAAVTGDKKAIFTNENRDIVLKNKQSISLVFIPSINGYVTVGGSGSGNGVKAELKYIAGEAITKGDAVYVSVAGDTGRSVERVYRTDLSNDIRSVVIGIANETVTTAGSPVTIVLSGVVDGLSISGSLLGQYMYLKNGTDIPYLGAYTSTKPEYFGQKSICIGHVVTGQDVNGVGIFVNPAAYSSYKLIIDGMERKTINDNVSSFTKLTDYIRISNDVHNAAIIHLMISITTLDDRLFEVRQLKVVVDLEGNVSIAEDYTGDETGVEITLGALGYLEYKSPNIPNFVSGFIKTKVVSVF